MQFHLDELLPGIPFHDKALLESVDYMSTPSIPPPG